MAEEEEYDVFWRFVLNNKAALFFVLWNLFWTWLFVCDAYNMYYTFEHWGAEWGGECYKTPGTYIRCSSYYCLFLLVPSILGIIMWWRKVRFYKWVLAIPLITFVFLWVLVWVGVLPTINI